MQCINNRIAKWRLIFPRHPGAFAIGSQLLDETTPVADKSWQPSPAPMEKGRGAPVKLI